MDKLPRRGVYYIEDHKEVGGVNFQIIFKLTYFGLDF